MDRDILRQAGSIAIVGLEKNTGKTTVLNYLVEVLGEGQPLFLTSIGYDGEAVDLVTGTQKPRIFVRAGTLIATARSILPRCTVEKEILQTTGLITALGEVILFRALDDGCVELAGPSVIADMKRLVKMVRENWDVLPIIDGALSRLSSAGHGLVESVILCSGASVDVRFERIMDKTLLTAEQFNFPKSNRLVDFSSADAWLLGEKATAFTASEEGDGLLRETDLLRLWQPKEALALKGLLSEAMVGDLLAWKGFYHKTVILEDATRLLISPETYARLKRRHIHFEVLQPVKLLCIALNPWSPMGRWFDEARAREILRVGKVPIINVRKEHHELENNIP